MENISFVYNKLQRSWDYEKMENYIKCFIGKYNIF